MACLSPSPSGRRLSELLEEKQEPFLLDIHLLEKGCLSSRLLDGYDTALCWPAAGNDAAAVLKRLTSKKNKAAAMASARGGNNKKQQPAGGLLKLLLSKILHGKAAANGGRKPAALQFSDSFKMASAAAAAPPPPCDAVKTGEVKKHETESYSDDDEFYSDEDEKQLSPVSVLEPHPFESSPIRKLSPSKNAAMDIFRELLDAASYSPALLTQLLNKSDDLVKDTAAADEQDDYYYGSYCTSPRNKRYNDAAYWEANRAELAKVSELIAAEVPSARLDSAASVQPERDDVGAAVAAAMLDSLLQEIVADLGRCC